MKGLRCGMYISWSKCKEVVKGFFDAKFKDFRSYQKVVDYLRFTKRISSSNIDILVNTRKLQCCSNLS